MNWKIFSIVCFVLILPVLGKWYFDSRDYGQTLMFSREKKEIVTIEKDELFGNESKKVEWQDGFWLGLMPPTDKVSPSLILGAVPMSSILVVIGIAGLFLHKKYEKKKK